MKRRTIGLALAATLVVLVAASCGGGDDDGGGARFEQDMRMGWTPRDSTGVFYSGTDYFETGAADGNT